MNVIAADMCTNARRVRKRWLPKIKSMLPEGVEMYRSVMGVAASAPLDPEFPPTAGQAFEQRLYAERRGDTATIVALRTDAVNVDLGAPANPAFEASGEEADGAGSVIQEVAAPEPLPPDGQGPPQPFEQGGASSSRPQTPAARRPEGSYAGTL